MDTTGELQAMYRNVLDQEVNLKCYEFELVHILYIRPGDVVICESDKKVRTVCEKDVHRLEGVGITVFGDSYSCGYRPVARVVIRS
jgi:hypothetical protein